MKIKHILAFGFIVTLLLTACEKEVTTSDNRTIDDILLDAQKSMAKTYQGFDVAITTSLWLAQVEGVSGTAYDRYNYIMGNDATNDLWSKFYLEQLKNLDSVITYAETQGGGYYKAVAEILAAESWATLTDLFGDVPFTEAFQNLNPVYDQQQIIYNGVFNLLDDAISIIESGQSGNIALGYGDAIYNWDMDKWLKFAYTLKARYTLRLSKVQSVDYNQVLSFLDKGLSALSDEPRFYFGDYGILPPIYEYISKNKTLSMNEYFIGLLSQREDPRFQALQYNGYWAQPGAYFPMAQYTEALFLRAQADYNLGNYDNVRTDLKNAIKTSLDKYMIPDYDDWYSEYSNYVDTLSADSLLNEIAIQEYFDLIYTPECYSEWRRLRYPEIPVVTDEQTTPPLRYPYPQDELTNNDNAPDWDNFTIFTPVWWDR